MSLNPDLESVWIEYRKTKSSALRNQLILNYAYLVKFVINRLWGTYQHRAQIEDMFNQGVIGLIDAIERYDYTKGVKFDTYAYYRIRGEIIDQFRRDDWIPKNVRIQSKKLQEAIVSLEYNKGRTPEDIEISDFLSISIDEYYKIESQIHVASIVSIEELIYDSSNMQQEIVDSGSTPEKSLFESEIKRLLANAIDDMPEKEKLVLSLYYFDEMNIKEIGLILGVSDSRVSQIHTKALGRLKSKLTRHKDLLLLKDEK
ncbi:MAG: FliA/WhiG family RNA polymerase sigma factor [Patescibacteria group bacterium]|nr:FliA/WhiG family RNA polymerase sigma factor [Patescibacteria group bacterium]